MVDLTEIANSLGRIEATGNGTHRELRNLREDFVSEKEAARESRKDIHDRLDDQGQEIAHLDKTVAISAAVDAQIRQELTELRKLVKDNHDEVQPHIEDIKRMKTLGLGISGLIATAGLTVGAIVAYASDAAVTAVRHWLRIL